MARKHSVHCTILIKRYRDLRSKTATTRSNWEENGYNLHRTTNAELYILPKHTI
jgi:hypothetical protein